MGVLRVGLRVLIVLIIGLQLVPYGRRHDNPPVTAEPAWDAPRTRELFVRACGDCHSNATRWPWYSHVAPVSWLVQRDVAEGREHFNVSEWGRPGRNEGEEAAAELARGSMPIRPYLLTHPEAKLAPADRQALISGLSRTFGGEESGHDR